MRVASRSGRRPVGRGPRPRREPAGRGLAPRLPALALADDAGWAGAVLAPRLGLAAGTSLQETRALSYKPERRCVFYYRWSSASGGVAHFAKLFRDDRGQELFSRHRAI